MTPRLRTVAPAVAIAAAGALVGASPAGAQAPAPAGTEVLLGKWAWQDRDEALVNRHNPRTVAFSLRNGKIRGRFGAKRSFAVRWTARTQRVAFVARRRAGKRTVRVYYAARVRGSAARPRMNGEVRILSPRFPGVSAFSAHRTRAPS